MKRNCVADQFVTIKSPSLTLATENPITKHIYVSIHGIDVHNKQKYIAADMDLKTAENFCKDLINAIKAARGLIASETIEMTMKQEVP